MLNRYNNRMLTTFVIKEEKDKIPKTGIYFTLPEEQLAEFKALAKKNKLNVNKTLQKFITDLITKLK